MDNNKIYKKINASGIETYISFFPQKEEKIYVQLFVKAGYCFAEPGKKFIPHLLEHVIANKFMGNELEFEATAGIEYLIFCLESNKKDFLPNFEKFINSIFDQDFPKEGYENEKMALINELTDKEIKLEDRTFAKLLQVRYKTKYYSQDEFNKKNIQESKLSEIENYYKKYFKDKNMKLIIGTRKFDEELINKIKNIITNAKITNGGEIAFPDSGDYNRKNYIKEKYDSPKAHLSMAWPCPSFKQDTAERVGMNIIREMLVSGYKSILFQKLRIKNGIVYDIHAETIMLNKAATFAIYVAVEKNSINETIGMIKASIDEIKDGKVDKKLLEKIIDDNINANKKEWDSNSRFGWIVGDLVDFDRIYDAKEINEINKSISIDFLSKIANKYLDHEYLNVIEYSK